MDTDFQRILREVREASPAFPPMTNKLIGVRGKNYLINRPTENDACDSIRLGYLVLTSSYKGGSGEAYGFLHQCKHCKQYKSASAFSPDSRKRNGLESWCCDCRAERKRELRWSNAA